MLDARVAGGLGAQLNEVMKVRCWAVVPVSWRVAIPISCTMPLRTFSTAVIDPACARYQRLRPIARRLPGGDRRGPGVLSPGLSPPKLLLLPQSDSAAAHCRAQHRAVADRRGRRVNQCNRHRLVTVGGKARQSSTLEFPVPFRRRYRVVRATVIPPTNRCPRILSGLSDSHRPLRQSASWRTRRCFTPEAAVLTLTASWPP